MYIKWIICNVEENKRHLFSDAQKKWRETSRAYGFIGQSGGWDLKNKNVACIISFWESKMHLDDFMKNLHDRIFDNNKQAGTYESIEIKHFDCKLKINGSSKSLGMAIKTAKLLRTAHCFVKPERSKHFEEAQNNIWNPGMNESDGMLGGVFSIAFNNSQEYLVSSFWDSTKSYNYYVKNKLPDLQRKSNVKNNIDQIKGRQILLVDSWEIIK